MNTSPSSLAARRAQLLGGLLGAAALALYLVSLSPVFFPGESAALVAEHLGVATFPPMTHSLWGQCVKLVALIPIGSAPVRLNAFSAVCGAAAIWLLFQLMLRVRMSRTADNRTERAAPGAVAMGQVVAAVVACLYLAISLPVWMVSTRAHPLAFDLAVALWAFYLLLRFHETGRVALAYGSALVYTLAASEFPTLIPVALLYGGILFVALYRRGLFRAAIVAKLVAIAAVGFLPYIVTAWCYARTPAYEWRAFESFWQVLWYIWLEQYWTLTRTVPRVGWLAIGMVSVVPWLFVMGLRSGGRPGGRGLPAGVAFLYVLLSALAVALLFDIRLTPWNFTGGLLMVTPYVFIAMWAGYLAGCWYTQLQQAGRLAPLVRRGVAGFLGAALLGLLAWNAWRAWPMANGRAGVTPVKLADITLDNLHGRTWLISAGVLDDNLALAAWQRGIRVNLLNPRFAHTPAYGRYVASLFEEPRYKSLAQIGLAPLLTEWVRQEPGIAGKLAVVNSQDLFLEAGLQALPQQVLYLGVSEGEAVDVERLAADFHQLLDTYGVEALAASERRSPVRVFNRQVVNHLAKMANNLGVFLEDRDRADLAYDFYLEARQLDTNNLSALINLHTLARRTERPEAGDLEAQLKAIAANPEQRHLWGLSYYHGYVRSPEQYAARGWAWAMSGKANLAEADMKRAMEMGGDHPALQLALARIYFSQERAEESADAYLKVLAQEPDNTTAILGLARVAMRRSDYDSARAYLTRLEDLGVSPRVVQMERAMLDILSGNAAGAAARLSDLVKSEPDNLRAWAALAAAALQAQDDRLLQSALAKLQSARMVDPNIRLALARLALGQNDRQTARRHLEELLRVQPASVPGLESLLQLSVAEGQRDEAERLVERLINADSDNALGNYVLGTLQVYREQYALAESSFRASLSTQPSPEVLNDLAWLLLQRGALDEALGMIRQALELDDRRGSSWDTYGAILMRQGNLAEAEPALQKALALRPESPSINLNMALLLEKRGLAGEARRLGEKLLARPTDLSRDQQDELRDLMQRLRAQP